jgi:hypothetical protein
MSGLLGCKNPRAIAAGAEKFRRARREGEQSRRQRFAISTIAIRLARDVCGVTLALKKRCRLALYLEDRFFRRHVLLWDAFANPPSRALS